MNYLTHSVATEEVKYSVEWFISIVILQAAAQILMKNATFIQWSPEFYDKLFI